MYRYIMYTYTIPGSYGILRIGFCDMFCCVCDPSGREHTFFGSEVSKLGSCFSGSGFKSSEKVVLRTYFFKGGWDTKKHVYIYIFFF